MNKIYDRNFAIAFIAQSLFVLCNALFAHYARYIGFLGGDVKQIGWIMGVGAVGGLVLRPWMGPWIDRIGARNTWALGYVIFVTAAIGNLFLTGLGPAIYVLRTLTELGTALVFASGLTYITQVAPPSRRIEAIGTLGAGGFVGMLFGPYIGDVFLGHPERTRWDFNWMFLTGTAAVCLSILLIYCLRPEHGPQRTRSTKLSTFFAITTRNWPGMILAVCVMFGVCITIPFVFLSKYVDAIGLRGIGPFFWAYAGLGLFLRISLRKLPERIGPRKVMIAGLVAYAVGIYGFMLIGPETTGRLIFVALFCGAAHSFVFHPMISLSMDAFPEESRGVGSVVTLMAMDVGRVGGAPILGTIAKAYGYSTMFLVAGSAVLATAVAFSVAALRQTRLASQPGTAIPTELPAPTPAPTPVVCDDEPLTHAPGASACRSTG